jgi:hypothetical protein
MPATPEDRLFGLTTSVAVKPPVAISADYNVILFGQQTITSSTFTGDREIKTAKGMRVLLIGQSNPVENGIWLAGPSAWERASDFNGARDAVNGTLVFSIYGDCWQVDANNPLRIGHDEIHFRSTYPFSDTLNWYRRAIRVPESYVKEVASVDVRKNSLLGFNDIGDPVPIFSWSSIADLALKLAGYYGPKYIGYMFGTLWRKLKEAVSVQDYMTDEEIADANSANPTMDVTHAFVSALAESLNVLVPPVKGAYIVDGLAFPLGANLYGYSWKPYTVSSDADLYRCGSVIRKKPSATHFIDWRSRATTEGIIFDGFDKTVSLFRAASDVTKLGNIRAVRCGFYRNLFAIGGDTGKYIGVQLSDCQIASNFRGVYNTVDSMFNGCTINANDDDGVNLQQGANDNTFNSCRMEWNGGNNFVAVGALNNTIIGELNDRAGKAGIAVLNRSEVFVTGVRMRRNGRYAAVGSADNSHFRLEGEGSSLIINGVNTKIGADDNGGGQTSPQYSIYTGGSSANMKLIVSGSDFEGSTGTHFYPATMPTNTRIIGNIGLNDVSTSGFDRVLNGSRFVYGLTKQVSGPGQAISIPLQQPAYNQTSRYPSREIQIKARNTADGTDEIYSMKVSFSTESYGSRFIVLDEKSTPASRFGTTGAVVNVAITDLVADASSFNVAITPTDAKNREINVFLV